MARKVSKSEVIAFRLNAHHLNERLPEESLLNAAGACGIQNSPPGSALLALHARVQNFSLRRMEDAVARDKTLLQTWCMRGSPYYFPTADAPVFTSGVLPTSEAAQRHFIIGVEQSLKQLDMTLAEAVEYVESEICDVLKANPLAIGPLGAELARRIAARLRPKQRQAWESIGPYAPNQPLGEAVIHFCIRIVTLRGIICFGPRDKNKAPFMLINEWIGHPIAYMDPELARAELLRRYLRCYGPSTPKDFASWVGVLASDADAWWNLVKDEMTEVEFGGVTSILTADLQALRSARNAGSVRLLPPGDPYTRMRDRETIADEKFHREIWKTIGAPGTVLAAGKLIGVWHPRKSGRRLAMVVRTFSSLPVENKKAILDEAERIALLRDASLEDIEFETY